VVQELKHCYSACLYTCYELIRPDFAIELSWKHKIIDFAFPFILQVLREYTTKVDQLAVTVKKHSEKSEQQHHQHQQTPVSVPPGVMLPPGVPVSMPPGGLPPGMLPPGVMSVPPGTINPVHMPPGAYPPNVIGWRT
jgi:clathrin heavy chain